MYKYYYSLFQAFRLLAQSKDSKESSGEVGVSGELPSPLSPSLVFIFSRPFLIHSTTNYLNAWNVMECLLFQDHSQQRAEKTKIWGKKIDKFPKECHLLAFIMLLSVTVILLSFERCMSWAHSDVVIFTFTCTSDYCFLNTLLLLVLRLWGYCYSKSCANHSPWIKSYSQVRLLI